MEGGNSDTLICQVPPFLPVPNPLKPPNLFFWRKGGGVCLCACVLQLLLRHCRPGLGQVIKLALLLPHTYKHRHTHKHKKQRHTHTHTEPHTHTLNHTAYESKTQLQLSSLTALSSPSLSHHSINGLFFGAHESASLHLSVLFDVGSLLFTFEQNHTLVVLCIEY